MIRNYIPGGLYPSLKERIVFITGGASGIGAEIVKAFVQQGSRVGFLDRDEENAARLQEKLSNVCVFEKTDLQNIDELKQSFKKLETELGVADILVNNAANDYRHNWNEVTPEYWDERMATNLRHQFFSIQAVASGMIDKGAGSIINLGSNFWWEAGGSFPVYATAKSAVRSSWINPHHGQGFGMPRYPCQYRGT